VQGAEHPNTLLTMRKLGDVYADWGRLDEADRLITKVLEARRRVLGEKHPDTVAAMELKAEVLRRRRMPAAAETILTSVLDAKRATFGVDHPDTLRTMASIGRVRLEQRKYAEAETVLRDAISDFEKASLDIWNRYDAESRLGDSLLGQAKFMEAEPHLITGYNGLLRLQATIPAYYAPEIARAKARIVELYRNWQRPEKLAEWVEK
jgi:tetratricopeptide (TPR) repeat protein